MKVGVRGSEGGVQALAGLVRRRRERRRRKMMVIE